MERKKYFKYLILMPLILFDSLNLQAQENREIYDGYISGDMDRWLKEVQRIEGNTPHTLPVMLNLAEYYYGYTAWLIGNKKDKEAKTMIKKAEELLDVVFSRWSDNSKAHALKGAFLGYRIGLSKFKSVFLGPKSMKHIDKSLELDPGNPQGLIEKGNTYYYMPGVLGGDKETAAEYYQKAIDNMEERNQVKNNWLYLNQLAVLAQLYDELNNPAKAQKIYQKILRVEPNFLWVKNELYPDFLKKTEK